jgi:alpha-glucosidase
VFKYWLETKHVDGFRIDAVKHFFESENFENEPAKDPKLPLKDTFKDSVKYDDMLHPYTANLNETYELLYEWRQICDDIGKRTNSPR